MLRRLNYTSRQRILREHFRFSLVKKDGALPTLHSQIELSSYGFPPDAKIFVECRRQSTEVRFDYNVVDNCKAPRDLSLALFGSEAVGLRCRIKVVESGQKGRIIGVSSWAQLESEIEQRIQRKPLMTVKSADLGQEVWTIDYDGPDVVLLISERLGDYKSVARWGAFEGLVYPAAMREILTRILLVDQAVADADTDGESWVDTWIAFSRSLPGVDSDIPDDLNARIEWIDSAVAAFSRRKDMLKRFGPVYSRMEGV